jgi:ribosomal protein S1
MTGEEVETTERPLSISALEPKMRLQGVVRETGFHGAVVDIGLEQDGLVHISQLSPTRVNRVADVVRPGDDVTVWVTKVNPEKGRVGLTMIEPPAVDWHELAQGQIRKGVVTRLESYGAFVDIGAERAGLLHVREMSAGYVRHPSELVKIGDEVEVRIVKYDRRKRRIDLSMIGIEPVVEEEGEAEEPLQTSMELALERARAGEPTPADDTRRRARADLSEQEAILVRTLKQHSKR